MSIIYFEGFETVGTEIGLAYQATTRPRIDLRFDATSYGGIPSTDSFYLIDDDYSEGYAINMGQNGAFSSGNYLEMTPSQVQQGAPGPSTPTVIVGFRVHVASLARTCSIFYVRGRYGPTGTDRQFEIAYVNSVDLKLSFGSGITTRETTVTGVFSPGNWHYVEVKFKCAESADGGMVQIKVDGTTVLTQDPQDMNNNCSVEAYEWFRWHNASHSAASGDFTGYDDIYILDADTSPHTTYLGPCRVRSLPPSSDHLAEWSGTGPPNYAEVGENGADDTDYIETDVDNATDIYNVTDTVEPDAIYAVKLEAEAKNTTVGTPSLEFQLKSGASTETAKETVDNASYELFTHYNEADPATGSDWTNTAIDAMRAGLRFDNEIG